jgi:hypothetical protein
VTTTEPPTVEIDGQPVPLDDCIWLERRTCGCVTAATVALVAGAWSIATPEQAMAHWNPTERDRALAAEAGRTAEPITGARYRAEFTGDWHCDRHATPGGAA